MYCRLKTKKNLESTIYCLSPEELLQTAQEILYEVRKDYSTTWHLMTRFFVFVFVFLYTNWSRSHFPFRKVTPSNQTKLSAVEESQEDPHMKSAGLNKIHLTKGPVAGALLIICCTTMHTTTI